MKHLEDIQITKDIEVSIFETLTGFIIDIKNEKGELIEGRDLYKDILVDHIKESNKLLYIRKGMKFNKLTNEDLLK